MWVSVGGGWMVAHRCPVLIDTSVSGGPLPPRLNVGVAAVGVIIPVGPQTRRRILNPDAVAMALIVTAARSGWARCIGDDDVGAVRRWCSKSSRRPPC
jgi:hypothetical protein